MISRAALILLMASVFGISAKAADLSKIFPSHSQTSQLAAQAVTSWLKTNCKDLTWALDVSEKVDKHEICGAGIEKVHLNVELSHLVSEVTFWVKVDENKNHAKIEWINEDWPSWRICSYSEAYFREDKTCRHLDTYRER